jgi:hypothetical protein
MEGIKDRRKTTTKRLDIERRLVKRAKIAFAKKAGLFCKGLDLDTIAFRDVMDKAIGRYGRQIVRQVKAAGIAPLIKEDIQKRQRPVTIATWCDLERYANDCGISRIQIIRAALELSARSTE